MKLIADTNVWYDIGNGLIDPSQFSNAASQLWATPISLLEIASGIDSRTLEERRRAAVAVINHSAGITEDSETHLARMWDPSVVGQVLPWLDGFKAIANAKTVAELEHGVEDLKFGLRRRVKVRFLQTWREDSWRKFQIDIVNALDNWIPGYADARAEGRFVKLAKQDRQPFKDAMMSSEVKVMTLMATYERTRSLHKGPPSPPHERSSSLLLLLSPYIDAYSEYVIRCAIEMAPQANDFGDFESLVFLQPGVSLVTRDKRWVEILRAVCPTQILVPVLK